MLFKKRKQNNEYGKEPRLMPPKDILLDLDLSPDELYHVCCVEELWNKKRIDDCNYFASQPSLSEQIHNECHYLREQWELMNSGKYYSDEKLGFTDKGTKEIIDDKVLFCLKIIGPELFLARYHQFKTKKWVAIKDAIYECVYFIYWDFIMELVMYIFEHDRGKFLLEYIASGGGPELEIDPDCQKLAREILENNEKR